MIIIAKDEKGNDVFASTAKSGRKYNCKWCNATLHKQKSSKGNDYFACNPGESHTHNICKSLSQKGGSSDKQTRYNMKQFDKDEFFDRILKVNKKNVPRRDTIKVNQANMILNTSGDQDQISERSFSTLKQIWDEGLVTMSPNTPLGSGLLSDVLVSIPAFADTLKTSESLGQRVLVACPEVFYGTSQSILFTCFWLEQKRGYFRSRLLLEFSNKTEFKIITEELFKKNPKINGSVCWEAHYSMILIAGDWKYTPPPVCNKKCNECRSYMVKTCFGYQRTDYIGKRQIYCPPETKCLTKP